jgi:3-hydroxybutyryl-CoA dehydrogenase
MKNHSIKKIGVIGEGKMGTDIFYFLNDFGFQLTWICSNNCDKNELIKKFNKRISRLFKSNILNEEKYNYKLNNTIISDNINELSECDIIIEAIFEDKDKKIELFKQLDKVLNIDCIISSNSSSIIPSKFFINENRNDKIIGLHFFYPIKFKNIVELIFTENTDENIKDTIKKILKEINIFPLILNEENPFILNKILLDLQALSYNIYKENVLSIKEIDEIIKNNLFPTGVFELFDSVGNDIMLTSIENYITNYDNKDYYIPLIHKLEELVKQNKLGIKTKEGFYNYQNEKASNNEINKNKNQYINNTIDKLKYIFINSSYKSVEKKICTFDEIEYAMKEYMGIEKGPIELSNEIGKDKIFSGLMDFYKQTKNSIYYPSILLK